MAGGLFAIDRSYFFEIGSYDTEMSYWGEDWIHSEFLQKIKAELLSRLAYVFSKLLHLSKR